MAEKDIFLLTSFKINSTKEHLFLVLYLKATGLHSRVREKQTTRINGLHLQHMIILRHNGSVYLTVTLKSIY